MDNGLNRYDWITAGIGVLTAILGLVGVITGTKANNIRMDQQAEAMKKLMPAPDPTTFDGGND